MTRDKQGRVSRANERKVLTDKLSPKERLDKLNSKFGEGKGAQKERARLQKMLSGNMVQNQPALETVEPSLSPEIMAQIEEINAPSKKKTRAKKNNA